MTNSGGTPIGGALVKATNASGNKSLSRYTSADGRYELTVAPGQYGVVAEAFGFGLERRSTGAATDTAVNFTLAPDWSVEQFTGADIDLLIPDHAPAALLKSTCINCHALDVMLRHRGLTATQWRALVEKPMMQRIGRGPFNATDAEWTVLTSELERLFGPSGTVLRARRRAAHARAASASGVGTRGGQGDVHRVPVAEPALHAAQPRCGCRRERLDRRVGQSDQRGAAIRFRDRAVHDVSRAHPECGAAHTVRDPGRAGLDGAQRAWHGEGGDDRSDDRRARRGHVAPRRSRAHTIARRIAVATSGSRRWARPTRGSTCTTRRPVSSAATGTRSPRPIRRARRRFATPRRAIRRPSCAPGCTTRRLIPRAADGV